MLLSGKYLFQNQVFKNIHTYKYEWADFLQNGNCFSTFKTLVLYIINKANVNIK